MTLRFHSRYFIIMLVLFATEVLIAAYVHDDIIRPYVGDFLVVILIYCFIKTFVQAPTLPVAIGVLVFSFLIEAGQYIHFISLLGWEHSVMAKLVLGNSFAWMDLVMYTAGILFIIVVEMSRERKKKQEKT